MSGLNIQPQLTLLDTAVSEEKISLSAANHIVAWLDSPVYAEYHPAILEHIDDGKWETLDNVFWTVIPFGTGGRRGKMYPIGCNAINDRTIGESAQGLANYILQQREKGLIEVTKGQPLSCAIAYDTRHRSLHFAQLCASIMVAAGFHVYFLEDYRSTPELSFLVREKNCSCGIMVTASHNPPSDNAVKVYWNHGGQVLPPHDRGIIDCVNQVGEIEKVPFETAFADGKIDYCQKEIDARYLDELARLSFQGRRNLKILYSPLHGVGNFSVPPLLKKVGFNEVESFADQSTPDGDFPNVPNHVSNPENEEIFYCLVEHARSQGAELILVTDPDCDRLGVAAPLTSDISGRWENLTGNQISALLTDYVLEKMQGGGKLAPESYVVKTLVTTELVRRIAESYNVRVEGNLLVGFKWIGQMIDKAGPENFVFGSEESHGYLAGTYARDKDGAIAAMLMAELVADLKAKGQTVHEKLEALFWQHGYHAEKLINIQMEGAQGMANMEKLMATFRECPPKRLAGLLVTSIYDYQNQVIKTAEGTEPLDGPQGNMMILYLQEEGNYLALRPSGTEPKIKFYLFAYTPPEELHLFEPVAEEMNNRLCEMENDLREFSKQFIL
ncbi:MAG: phospho-sugar mutase [Pirellulaceae bacterium]|nr:phospho-sugar mutase [Pirellulaceae bacterium]